MSNNDNESNISKTAYSQLRKIMLNNFLSLNKILIMKTVAIDSIYLK